MKGVPNHLQTNSRSKGSSKTRPFSCTVDAWALKELLYQHLEPLRTLRDWYLDPWDDCSGDGRRIGQPPICGTVSIQDEVQVRPLI